MSTLKHRRIFTPKNEAFNISPRDGLADFLVARQSMQVTKTTIENYRITLSNFITWLEGQGITTTQEIAARHVRQYLAQFSGKSDWTIASYAKNIRTLVRFWHKEGYLPQPVIFDMPKVRQKRLPFLTADQVKKVLSFCDARQKAVFLLLVDSGLRRQEACNLNWSDVNLQTGTIIVKQGKGKKDRIAIIGATTRRALLNYLRLCPNKSENAPLLQTETGSRMTGYGLQSLLRRLSHRSGIKFTAHSLRRTFATLALQGGMDLVSLQTLLGHNSIETTRQYIQWLDADLIEAHRKASPIDNLKRS